MVGISFIYREEFYRLFYSVFDDQHAAMETILKGKECFSFLVWSWGYAPFFILLSFQILHFMIFILRYLVGSESWLLALSCLCHFWRRKLSIERNMQRKYYSESLQVRAEKKFSFFTILFLIHYLIPTGSWISTEHALYPTLS